jgi:hypothetical protein
VSTNLPASEGPESHRESHAPGDPTPAEHPQTPRGPYVDQDGDAIYLPVSDYPFNVARREAASLAEEMNGSWERTRYQGKHLRALHDHDEPWDGSDCACPPEQVWSFELYEGTYRR